MEINSGVHLFKSQICEVSAFVIAGGLGLMVLVSLYFGLGLKNLVLFIPLVSAAIVLCGF